MKQYLTMLEHILANGDNREDRTGTGRTSVFGYQTRYDLRKGFPLMTTKQMPFRIIFEELMWFLRGETNVKTLLEKDVKIWNGDAYRFYRENLGYYDFPLTKAEFFAKILSDDKFAEEHGDLGKIYGKQWRSWESPDGSIIDQIENVIQSIKDNPYGTRHIVSAWNPGDLKTMALPPCHILFQFYVNSNRELSCQLYQRSGDGFLGVPFNIASYALLTHMIADRTGYSVGEFVHTIGDLHLYNNHMEAAMEQISRTPKELPTLGIKRNHDRKEITDYVFEDFTLIGYKPEPTIKAPVSTG